MKFHKALRAFSFFFNGLVLLGCIAIAAVLLTGKPVTVNYELLPLAKQQIAYGLLALAAVGAAVMLVASRGKAQILYAVWSLLVLLLVVRFFFFSDYGYVPGSGDFSAALWIVLAAIIAAWGASLRQTSTR